MKRKSQKEIRKQLTSEIKSLEHRRGFIYAGRPLYDRLFGRDSLIVSWQLLDINPLICKKTLEILIKFQGKKIDNERDEEPGKILHETDLKYKIHPNLPDFLFPNYGSVDSTPLFLIMFGFYFRKTKDVEFVKKYWKNILAALNWIINYGGIDKESFLEYQNKALRHRGIFHQGWKDDWEDHLGIKKPPIAIVEAQGYAYLAFKEIARISEILGDDKLAKMLLLKAEKLKKDFNKKFWMKDKKYFALALDGKKKQKKTIASNPGHLLFTGILNKEKEKAVIKKLFSNELWTPYGIRTHSIKEADFDPMSYHQGSIWPHDNWIIAQGLKDFGYREEYQKIKTALLAVHQKLGFIPELYGVVNDKLVEISRACHPQAWASGALLNFLSLES